MASRDAFRNSQSHWGIVPSATLLQNTASAPPGTYDFALRMGDTQYVSGEAALYVCTDSTAGAATWERLGTPGIEITCAECNALNATNSAIPGQAYIVTDYNAGTVGPARILVHGTSTGSVGHTCDVDTQFDDSSWSGRFDPDTCRIYDLRDNRGNYIRGDIGIEVEAFPWGNASVYGNDFHSVQFVYTAGSVIDNVGGPTARLEVNVGDVRQSSFQSGADVRVTGGFRIYRCTVSNSSRVYANDGSSGELDRCQIDSYTYFEPGALLYEQCRFSSQSDIRTRGSVGSVINSSFDRGYMYVRNCPNVDIDDLTLQAYGRVLGDDAVRIRSLRDVITSYGYIQAALDSTLVSQYNSVSNLSFIRSRNTGTLNVAYNSLTSRGYIDHSSTGTNTANNNSLQSNAYITFVQTCTGTLVDTCNGSSNGRIQIQGSAPAGSRVHRCNVDSGRISLRNGTGTRIYYCTVQSTSSYIDCRSTLNPLIRDVHCASYGRMLVDLDRSGTIQGIELNSIGYNRIRGGTAPYQYSSFTGYYYYTLTNQTASKRGLVGHGRQSYTDPNPATATTGTGVRNF